MVLPRLGWIKFLTIHCSGSPSGRGDTAADVCQWDRERFGQPSYHFVIEECGAVVTCLTTLEKGAHVGGHNAGNIGVCLIGGLDPLTREPNATFTEAQYKSLKVLVAKFQLQYPGIQVFGHNEWPGVAKACPCFSVKHWLKTGEAK